MNLDVLQKALTGNKTFISHKSNTITQTSGGNSRANTQLSIFMLYFPTITQPEMVSNDSCAVFPEISLSK